MGTRPSLSNKFGGSGLFQRRSGLKLKLKLYPERLSGRSWRETAQLVGVDRNTFGCFLGEEGILTIREMEEEKTEIEAALTQEGLAKVTVAMAEEEAKKEAKKPPKIMTKFVQASTKFLGLESWYFKNKFDVNTRWDVCVRKKAPGFKKRESVGDAVVIIPILIRDGDFHVVMVKMFRPPIEDYTIEFPAGLIDPGESVAQAGLRELYEETGIQATMKDVFSVSVPAATSSGLTNERVNYLVLKVEDFKGDPKPKDVNEIDEAFVVPLDDDLCQRIGNLSGEAVCHVRAFMIGYTVGYEIASTK